MTEAATSSLRFDFRGQTVLVSGGTRGIGAAIARRFIEAGADVVALYRSNAEAAEAFAAGFDEPARARLRTTALDVADADAVQAYFAGWQGRLDVLVNNAGIRGDALVGMLSEQRWRDVLGVNLDGTFRMCKFAARLMVSQRYGRVINVSSPAASLGIAGLGAYGASKAGVLALTRTLSREVARRGVTVNCVTPGFVDTDLVADLPEARRKQMVGDTPMKRFGRADEIAAAVLFLASREASFVTGANLAVTGGIPC